MSCKNLNLLLVTIFCSLTLAAGQINAQGLVSLSEEAMFDDGLDTEMELPTPEVPNIEQTNKQPSPELPVLNASETAVSAPANDDVDVSKLDIIEEDNGKYVIKASKNNKLVIRLNNISDSDILLLRFKMLYNLSWIACNNHIRRNVFCNNCS